MDGVFIKKVRSLENVYLTVLTNDRYIKGVKALKKSLVTVKSQYRLAVLVPEDKKAELSEKLSKFGLLDEYCFLISAPQITCDFLNEDAIEKITATKEAYWLSTFFKIRAASCVQFNKIVLLDSDMIILGNIDELFSKPSYTAVVATKCVCPEYVKLNSGLMVLEPSTQLFQRLLDSIEPALKRKFECGLSAGDQDVFQEAFPDWEEHPELDLPEIYNAVWFCIEKLCEVYHCKKKDIKVVHFTGAVKPFTRTNVENLRITLSYIIHLKIWRACEYLKYVIYSR